MKHLVLGARGQIGGHLVARLRERGESVREIDIVLGEAHDLRCAANQMLADGVDDSDIIHFLAFDVGGSIYLDKYQDTYPFIANNVKIMNTVFDVLERARKPFLFASSQMSYMFNSTYGNLKAIGEAYTRSIGGLPVQLWNVFGWESSTDRSHVISDFIRMAHEYGRIEMRTDGSEQRQFIYGDDCADALIELSLRYDSIDLDRPLHVSSFKWTSIRRVAQIVSTYFGNCPVIPGHRVDTVHGGSRNVPDRYVTEFWKPVTPLHKGIGKVVNRMLGVTQYGCFDGTEPSTTQ